MALPVSYCMLACRNYAVRVEHCFWVLPDRRADKKLRLVALLYVLACDELTGSRPVLAE